MEHENLFEKLNNVMKEMERIESENPTAPDEPADPRMAPLVREGQQICRELDPLVREVFGNRRDTLAWWEDTMRKINSVNLEPEETDPRIKKLLDEGTELTRELDVIVRETYRDDPVTLAEWDSIMRMDPDYDKEDTG